MKAILILMVVILFGGCTENQRAKSFGGDMEIKLNRNETLINVTWKNVDMWLLTKDTTTNIIYFREWSSYGLLEGQIIIK